MVEVLEYALVVVASSILMFFSVSVYSGLATEFGPAADQATFASVVALANAATEHGSASATFLFSGAKLWCTSGVLTFATERYSQNSSLPVGCSFGPVDLSGDRRVTFDSSGGLLTLQVR